MGIIQEIEGIKYRFITDLITKEEIHDKKRNVITLREAFDICYSRYELMQEILLPLRQKLGDRVDVTDITFVNSNDDENGIIVKYTKDDKQYLLSISNLDYEDIIVVASDLKVQSDAFKQTNRKIILRTFRNISDNDLDININVKSTSGKFIIKDNGDSFNVKDSEGKVFNIDSKYSIYEKSGLIINPQSLTCNYPKLKELLEHEDNIKLIYNNLYIYEDDFPKQLIKKVN